MTNYEKIIPAADQILKRYDLCDNCLGRLFSKKLHLSSNRLLGKKLNNEKPSSHVCHICKNLFEELDYYTSLMIDASKNHSFSSFGVGAILKPSIVDRDDSIRSKYKLKGVDSVKTDLTRELSRIFSRKTKHRLDSHDPHVTFIVNLKNGTCQLRSKSLILYGRYVKNDRNLPQKQIPCMNCSGHGCKACHGHGICNFESVEGIISKFLFQKFGGTTAKYTWIGGEDKSSLVLGTGRPFFVKLQNPLMQKSKLTTVKCGSIEIRELKKVSQLPQNPIRFNSLIKIKLSTRCSFNSANLKDLHEIKNHPVVIYEKSGKRSEKTIYSLKYQKTSEHSLNILLRSDGGLPIKRFVAGDDVSPGIFQTIGCLCNCDVFDFLDVELF